VQLANENALSDDILVAGIASMDTVTIVNFGHTATFLRSITKLHCVSKKTS